MGGGWGEGGHCNVPLTLALSHKGRGKKYEKYIMKFLKHILIFILLLISSSLSSVTTAADASANAGSLYDMTAHLTDQDGKKVGLDVFSGHPVLVSMFYASCNYTCPILIDALKNLDSKLDPQLRKEVRFLLISFDPEHDTPPVLKKLAMDHTIDLTRWKFTAPDASEVRDIAALLSSTYRALPDGGFNHTSSMTLLNPLGSIIAQEEGSREAANSMLAQLKKFFNH